MLTLEGIELNWVRYQTSHDIGIGHDSNYVVWMTINYLLENPRKRSNSIPVWMYKSAWNWSLVMCETLFTWTLPPPLACRVVMKHRRRLKNKEEEKRAPAARKMKRDVGHYEEEERKKGRMQDKIERSCTEQGGQESSFASVRLRLRSQYQFWIITNIYK